MRTLCAAAVFGFVRVCGAHVRCDKGLVGGQFFRAALGEDPPLLFVFSLASFLRPLAICRPLGDRFWGQA